MIRKATRRGKLAKGGFFTGLALAAFGALATLSHKGHQLSEAKQNYLQAFDKAAADSQEEQTVFEAFVRSLPELKGDGKFQVPVNLDDADHEALGYYSTHLKLTKQVGRTVVVLLDALGDTEKGTKVTVEISQAEAGHLHWTFEDAIAQAIEDFGGTVRCAGRLTERKGFHELWLDIEIPVTVKDADIW